MDKQFPVFQGTIVCSPSGSSSPKIILHELCIQQLNTATQRTDPSATLLREPHIPIHLGLLIIWTSTTIQYSEQNTFHRMGLLPSSAVQSNKQSCSQSLNPHCMYQNHTQQMTNATAQTKLILHCLSLCHLNTVLQSPPELRVSNSYNKKDRRPKKLLHI